jgi:hypothetical protein
LTINYKEFPWEGKRVFSEYIKNSKYINKPRWDLSYNPEDEENELYVEEAAPEDDENIPDMSLHGMPGYNVPSQYDKTFYPSSLTEEEVDRAKSLLKNNIAEFEENLNRIKNDLSVLKNDIRENPFKATIENLWFKTNQKIDELDYIAKNIDHSIKYDMINFDENVSENISNIKECFRFFANIKYLAREVMTDIEAENGHENMFHLASILSRTADRVQTIIKKFVSLTKKSIVRKKMLGNSRWEF